MRASEGIGAIERNHPESPRLPGRARELMERPPRCARMLDNPYVSRTIAFLIF